MDEIEFVVKGGIPHDQGTSQIVHYGGDSGTTSDYRKGTLYFFHNTVVSTKSIEDEEEKGWAYRQLSGLGDKVLPAVKAFCLQSDVIESSGQERQSGWGWALRIVEDVADEVQEWDLAFTVKCAGFETKAAPPAPVRTPPTMRRRARRRSADRGRADHACGPGGDGRIRHHPRPDQRPGSRQSLL